MPQMKNNDVARSGFLTNLDGRRLLIAEEGLKTLDGHWFEYNRAVANANANVGVKVSIAAHGEVSEEVQKRLKAQATFACSSWDGVYNYPSSWRRYLGIAHHNRLVFKSMRRFVREQGSFDCVFAPTVAIHHVYGWRSFALAEVGKGVERLVLLFRNSIGDYHDGELIQSRGKRMIWQEALRPLRPMIKAGQIVLATDSSRLATEYRTLIGAELKVFPQPQITVREARNTAFDPSGTFTFGCLGPARLEKGVDLYEKAALAFLKSRPNASVRFILQWTAPIRLGDGSEMKPISELLADPRFVLIDQPMDSETYEAALADIDCMVLPYRRSSYHGRISGVAVEAATAGIPAIYTEDTWTADLIDSSGAGIPVGDEDVVGLTQALLDAYDSRVELTAKGRARADFARSRHSLEAFLECLWAGNNS